MHYRIILLCLVAFSYTTVKSMNWNQCPSVHSGYNPEELYNCLRDRTKRENDEHDFRNMARRGDASGVEHYINQYYQDERKKLVNAPNPEGLTALHLAASAEVASTLLHNGANVRARAGARFHAIEPIHRAAISNHTDIIKVLLSNRACLEAKDAIQRTPLFYAVMGGAYETAQYLLRAGADKYIRDTAGNTLLHAARDARLIDLIIQAYDETERAMLLAAVTTQGQDALTYHLYNGVHSKDNEIKERSRSIVAALIKWGVKVEPVCYNAIRELFGTSNQEGQNDQFFAALVAGNYPFVEMIVKQLHDQQQCAEQSDYRVVKWLKKVKATVDGGTALQLRMNNLVRGNAPIVIAVRQGHWHIVACLIAHGANYNAWAGSPRLSQFASATVLDGAGNNLASFLANIELLDQAGAQQQAQQWLNINSAFRFPDEEPTPGFYAPPSIDPCAYTGQQAGHEQFIHQQQQYPYPYQSSNQGYTPYSNTYFQPAHDVQPGHVVTLGTPYQQPNSVHHENNGDNQINNGAPSAPPAPTVANSYPHLSFGRNGGSN